MPPVLDAFLQNPSVQATGWFLLCAALFGGLQHLMPHDRTQPAIRRDWWVDAVYWIGGPVVYAGVGMAIIIVGLLAIFGGDTDAAVAYAQEGAAWSQDVPLWLLAIGALIVTDISMYWTHRLFHTGRLWKYHAIHHAPESLDWMHAVRFHPVNYVFHGLVANAFAIWVGFPPAALIALAPFNILYSAMVHANLNWTFGPLRYVFASPVYHRWHHTGPDEGGSSNFAPTFPLIDLLFGTYYNPVDRRPGATGLVERDMPEGLVGQLLYPFGHRAPRPAQPEPDTQGTRSPA
jgi:sterol desaturase/sphingolipid hydroxylase (fatty acid hydroxylase superfamily)